MKGGYAILVAVLCLVIIIPQAIVPSSGANYTRVGVTPGATPDYEHTYTDSGDPVVTSQGFSLVVLNASGTKAVIKDGFSLTTLEIDVSTGICRRIDTRSIPYDIIIVLCDHLIAADLGPGDPLYPRNRIVVNETISIRTPAATRWVNHYHENGYGAHSGLLLGSAHRPNHQGNVHLELLLRSLRKRELHATKHDSLLRRTIPG